MNNHGSVRQTVLDLFRLNCHLLKTQMRSINFLFISMSVFLLTPQASYAEASLFSKNGDILKSIAITGAIDTATANKVEELYTKEKSISEITLNSEGGSVLAAIRIGRIIRKHETRVEVYGNCFSSCFLIYIGGVSRFPYFVKSMKEIDRGDTPFISGIIGLHRPYINDNDPNEIIKEEDLRSVYKLVKDYFDEMNVSQTTFDIMMNTPPDEIKKFKDEEIYDLVPLNDPVYKEKTVFRASMIYGISTEEYRKRKKQADDCIYRKKEPNCREAVLWNIPGILVKQRETLEGELCKSEIILTKEEIEQIKLLKGDAMFASTAHKKLRDCRIAVMRGEKVN